jgi:L-threonylcarbamoyladenylate synthase
MAHIIPQTQAMDEALARLKAGEAVAVPTETVYGLAADATDGDAITRIYAAKRRPRFNPLICHVSGMAMARSIARFSPLAEKLAEAFWPGPLTLVLPQAAHTPVHPLATAGLDTIGVRVPVGFARELIEGLGRPLAAPSANSSGRISPTSAAAVAADLGDAIALVVDGGLSRVGVESTIVMVEGDELTLLRPGGVSVEAIEKIAGRNVRRTHDGGIVAPGMLASHYAPHALVRLGVEVVHPGEALLGFGDRRARDSRNAVAFLNLSPAGDLDEAARNLFSHLRALDAAGATAIAVEPIPDTGLGEAINDRLARAAAPRDGAA